MGNIHVSDSTIEEIAALAEYDRTGSEAAYARLKKARQESDMNNGTIEASFEQMKSGLQSSPEQARQAAQAMQAVNLDEVTNETILVKLLRYKEEPVFYDDGNPFCDEDGKQYMSRVSAGTRTAKIKNIVPVDAYHQAISISNGFSGGVPGKEQLDAMTDLVLECWRISEPFMTKKMLREGVDGERIMALFTRFFNKENPPSNASPSAEGNITQNKG
jgi:hypothetical protein